ncbi:MAG: hypothetical protein GY810_27220 [Aureispira sp.]|nr:hypothetical protein [Aureispira sp.]
MKAQCYNLRDALTYPPSTKELTLFLSKEKHSRLGELDKLVNLKKLVLLDDPTFSKLPTSILKLPQLTELQIRNLGITSLPKEIDKLDLLDTLKIEKTPIESLPNSIGKLEFLTHLYLTQTEIEKLPDSIVNCESLERITIVGSKLKTLPKEIGSLKQLNCLTIKNSNLKTLPKSFEKLSGLQTLVLNAQEFDSLPQGICNLKKLTYLDLCSNELTSLPKDLKKLNVLNNLYLNNNKFSTFPKVVCELLKLQSLQLYNNQLTEDLPKELFLLPKLEKLGIGKNQFKNFPYVVLAWFQAQKYSYWTLSVDKELRNNVYLGDIHKFLQSASYKKLEPRFRNGIFDLFINDKNRITLLSQELLLLAINLANTTVAISALDALLLRSKAKKLEKGSELVILGKTTKGKKELIALMKDCGLKYSTKVTENTTHVLLSVRSNKGLDKLPEIVSWSWITEAILTAYLDKVQPSFLVEKGAEPNVEKVSELIMTLNEDNMALALELLEGGGVPDSVMTEIFIVLKLAEDKALKKKAKKLLQKKASPALEKVLRNRAAFKRALSYNGMREFKEALSFYTTDTNLDYDKIVYAAYVKHKMGLEFVFNKMKGELRSLLIKKYIVKNDELLLSYSYSLERFPMELVEIPTLRKIRIYSRRSWFNGTKTVENNDFKIPENIDNLRQLEELRIYWYVFDSLPIEALSRLSKLKELELIVTSSVDWSILRTALPNCNLNIGVNKS